MNWKTKYINEMVSNKEEVIEVFRDGLFTLAEELNIQGGIEVHECRVPFIKQDTTWYTIDRRHAIELDVCVHPTFLNEITIKVNYIKLGLLAQSVESRANVCKIANKDGRYCIELDKGDYCLFNRHTVELIYKKIVEEYLFKRKEVDEVDDRCCVTVKTDHGVITDYFKQSDVVTICDTGIKVGGKSAYPVK